MFPKVAYHGESWRGALVRNCDPTPNLLFWTAIFCFHQRRVYPLTSRSWSTIGILASSFFFNKSATKRYIYYSSHHHESNLSLGIIVDSLQLSVSWSIDECPNPSHCKLHLLLCNIYKISSFAKPMNSHGPFPQQNWGEILLVGRGHLYTG